MLIEKLTHKNNKIILHNDYHSYTFMPSLYHQLVAKLTNQTIVPLIPAF